MSTEEDKPITVFLAQPRELTREGLRTRLLRDGRFEVVGEGATPDISLIRRVQPEVVIVDPRKASTLDVALLEELGRVSPSRKIVVWSRLTDPVAVAAALRANVRGYLSRARYMDGDFFCQTLVLVARYGGVVLGPEIARELAAFTGVRGPAPSAPEDLASLSEREHEVLALLAEGLNDAETADRLSVSESTVASHVHSMLPKVRAKTRLQLGFLAALYNLLGQR